MLDWGIYRNIENSLKDFLEEEVFEDNVTDYSENLVPIRIGRKESDDWSIPCISLYIDAENSPRRLAIGGNLRDRRFLLIFDIYATDEGQRLDLASWLTKKIEDGFNYYTYYYDPLDPDNLSKTLVGLANIDTFIANTRVALGQNVDEVDAHRHRISIQIWVDGCPQ